MDTNNFDLELKSINDNGTFEGFASTYGEDLTGDRILPGAFTKSLEARKKVPLLWNHQTSDVIGSVQSMTEEPSGLRVKARLNLDAMKAREAYSLLKAGDISGLSIGFTIGDFKYASKGIREIKSLDLYEVSLVAIPANPQARIQSVKSAADHEFSVFTQLATSLKEMIG
jgi:uncharacterized protein